MPHISQKAIQDICKILGEGPGGYLSFAYLANDFNSGGPEELASDDQHYVVVSLVSANQSLSIMHACFLMRRILRGPKAGYLAMKRLNQ